jgi:hypothetical protein
MSTTLVFIVLCPECRRATKIELAEFEGDPRCRWCGAPLSQLQRIEGFKRVRG